MEVEAGAGQCEDQTKLCLNAVDVGRQSNCSSRCAYVNSLRQVLLASCWLPVVVTDESKVVFEVTHTAGRTPFVILQKGQGIDSCDFVFGVRPPQMKRVPLPFNFWGPSYHAQAQVASEVTTTTLGYASQDHDKVELCWLGVKTGRLLTQSLHLLQSRGPKPGAPVRESLVHSRKLIRKVGGCYLCQYSTLCTRIGEIAVHCLALRRCLDIPKLEGLECWRP